MIWLPQLPGHHSENCVPGLKPEAFPNRLDTYEDEDGSKMFGQLVKLGYALMHNYVYLQKLVHSRA